MKRNENLEINQKDHTDPVTRLLITISVLNGMAFLSLVGVVVGFCVIFNDIFSSQEPSLWGEPCFFVSAGLYFLSLTVVAYLGMTNLLTEREKTPLAITVLLAIPGLLVLIGFAAESFKSMI